VNKFLQYAPALRAATSLVNAASSPGLLSGASIGSFLVLKTLLSDTYLADARAKRCSCLSLIGQCCGRILTIIDKPSPSSTTHAPTMIWLRFIAVVRWIPRTTHGAAMSHTPMIGATHISP